MKTIFIPAKVKSGEINEKKILSLSLPSAIAIAYSVQYKEIAEKIKEILSENEKCKITDFVQVLGCSKPRFSENTKAVLLVTSGDFHAVSLAFESKLPIYILEASGLRRISKEEIDAFERKKKASYIKFLSSNKIGILVSTKPGQENLKRAIALKSNSLKDKKFYLFLSNDISISEFENFSDIGSWINTACPRLDFDSSVVNMADLEIKG
jgi:diphthamide biosynthesis enzyme Dph1/Dph2-like protein